MIQTPSLRIGIEEEYQIVDPETRNLRYILTRTAVACLLYTSPSPRD